MPEGFKLEMGLSGFDRLRAVFKMFPKETQKASAKYLNDATRLFKDLAPKVLGSRYTIRNKSFVNAAFKHDKAKPTDHVLDQFAQVYTRRIEGGGGGLFTGWEEELTGERRGMRKQAGRSYHRLIWSGARGGNMGAQVKGQYRFRLNAEQDIISDSRNYGMPIPQFLAMLSKSPKESDGTKRIGKNKVFILEGAGFPLGLYRFKGMVGTSHPEVEALQRFKEDPPRAEKFDWQQMTLDRVATWFKPDYVWETYFVPILAKLWKKDK